METMTIEKITQRLRETEPTAEKLLNERVARPFAGVEEAFETCKTFAADAAAHRAGSIAAAKDARLKRSDAIALWDDATQAAFSATCRAWEGWWMEHENGGVLVFTQQKGSR